MMTVDIRNRDGFVSIDDNIVHVIDPEASGMPATITPCDGVDMTVNGQHIDRMVLVTAKDHIVLNPLVLDQPAFIHLTTEADDMEAWLEFRFAETILNRVREQLPTNQLVMEANTIRIPDKTFPLQVVKERLAEAGIVFGVLDMVLSALQENPREGKYLIASGLLPVEPEDDTLEIVQSLNEPVTRKPAEDETGRIDFWETVDYPVSKVGDILAVVRRGHEGANGSTVKGAVLKPRSPKHLEIQCNRTVRLEEDGRILAKKKGQPRFDTKNNTWTVSIEDRLELPSVSLKTGNVHYAGSVFVLGSVEDSMKVSAAGDIVVKGSVHFAHIGSGDSVQIAGGLLSGTVSAGMSNETISGVERDLQNIQQHLLGLVSDLQDVLRTTPNLQVHEAIGHLLNTKHNDLSMWMISFIRNLRSGKIGYSADLTQEVMTLFQPLLGDCSEIRKISDLQDIAERMAELFHQEVRQEPKGDVLVGYVLNSRIDAMGSVRVTGNGCTNSVIACGGDLLVLHHFRGGEASSGKRIIIASAGSEMGARTVLKVPANGSVTLFRVYSDTEVRLGRRSITFMKERVNLHIYLDAKGEITTRTADKRELTDK